jgi:hypothetical protein
MPSGSFFECDDRIPDEVAERHPELDVTVDLEKQTITRGN